MIFHQTSKLLQRSACGRYTIRACKLWPSCEWEFDAVREADGVTIATGTADECRDACRLDGEA